MARFRATMRGGRGEASRLGTVKSGIRATVNGWNLGVEVRGEAADRNGWTDVFYLSVTGGSNGVRPERVIGKLALADDGQVDWIPGPRIGEIVRTVEAAGTGEVE